MVTTWSADRGPATASSAFSAAKAPATAAHGVDEQVQRGVDLGGRDRARRPTRRLDQRRPRHVGGRHGKCVADLLDQI
ncbi:hypothetical protein [Actinokineospora inagensis]|uniref:hypothetical protein n=1 Tax=Actinokineospora inagensis TaxID=103730 RepID=UPI00047AD67F|nr:hypothetical protein [Actinokineospora inagensis]